MERQHWFLHADLDAFFASVEQLDHPEYRGKPVIVGGLPSDLRSVVSTASYEARKYGVHSAMPTKEAYRLCPNGIYLRGNYKRYSELSWKIMQIFSRFSPDIQQMSIDEAFIDLTGTELLFGPPEETAMKIKKAVKDEIGLTVSIGLASTKYFAKLSSEINKPDGFYFMKPGSETDYMLSIPIEKIWGIGKKTSARIKDSGLKTTRQIYETPLETLTFLYGENTANFLYNILRGRSEDMFGTETKNHSISNERTFPFDVTDHYANETALLELAHCVMFRLLKENLKSRTVTLKIRYDDFTTISARQTFETDILTLDSFFEKIKELFNKKYDPTRGVRLLGVGFDNVHQEESTYQQNLFDDGQKKKQAVEKAILKFEQKHPDLPVQKARVIKPGSKIIKSLFFIFVLMGFCNKKVYSQIKNSKGAGSFSDLNTTILPIPKEAPEQLFDIKLSDTQVEFFSSGFWKAEVSESFGFLFSDSDKSSFNFGIPVFKQEVDIDFKLLVNKHWFFETSFADEFKNNTITFGYQGNDILRNAIISNRNIVYPNSYSSNSFGMNPGGGQAQSPGAYANLKGDKWEADFMVRFDMVNSKSAVFYGKNQVSEFSIPLNNFVTNRFFYIPGNYISKIENVYINQGNTIKKLSKSDFYINRQNNLLIISKDAFYLIKDTPYEIHISFQNSSDRDNFISDIGTFSSPLSYLGKLQTYFSTSKNISLNDFSYNLSSEITGEKTVIIQSYFYFSPFRISSIYDTGNFPISDFSVYSEKQESASQKYEVSVANSSFLFSGKNSFSDTHNYASVYKGNDDSIESFLFPMADTFPELYLYPNSEIEYTLQCKTLTPVNSFSISNKANSGNISVYINGILDNLAKYDQTSGIIIPSKNIKETDKIYITWQEESLDSNRGVLSAGAGFELTPSPQWKIDTDITAAWPLTEKGSYATSSTNQNGYFAVSGGFDFNKGDFAFINKTNFAVTNENVTGTYLVYEVPSGVPETFYHSSNAGFISYKTPQSSYFSLNSADFILPGNLKGIKDPQISGFAIPVEVDFQNIPIGQEIYTSVDISLPEFKNCHTFTLALRNISLDPEDYDIFFQLGVMASDEKPNINEENLPTWRIQNISSVSSWQTFSFELSDSDRARLTGNHDGRIIIIRKAGKTGTKGTLLIGPYESGTDSIQTKISDNQKIKTTTVINSFPLIRQGGGKNLASKIQWDKKTPAATVLNSKILFGDYFKKADSSNYKKIELHFKLEDCTPLSGEENNITFTLCSGSDSLDQAGNIFLKVNLLSNTVNSLSKNIWHTITIDLSEKTLFIDSTKLSLSEYDLYLNKTILPCKIIGEINGFEKGVFYFDSIIFDEILPDFTLQDIFSVSYKKPGNILTLINYPIIKDFYISSEGKAGFSANEIKFNKSLSGNIDLNTTITGVIFSVDASISDGSNNILTDAGHSLKSEKPFGNIVSFSTDFRYSIQENSSRKKDSLSLDFKRFIPLSFDFSSSQSDNISGYSEENISFISLDTKYLNGKFTLSNSEKLRFNQKNKKITQNGYFVTFGNMYSEFFKFGNENASLREENLLLDIKGTIPYFSLKPEIKFSLDGEYISDSKTTFNDKEELNLIIPFEIAKQKFSISWTKSGGGTENCLRDGNYSKDIQKVFENQKERNWYYQSFPVYDLISPTLANQISDSSNCLYTGIYSASWNRPLFNSINDLFIPVNLSINFGREIKSSDSLSDYYSYSVNFATQAVNLFGSKNLLHKTSWFESDEYSSSFDLNIKHPRNDSQNIIYSISLYNQALFYINSDSSLKGAVDFSIDSKIDWHTKGSLVYISRGNRSPLASIISFFIKSKNNEEPVISRKETLNIDFGKSTDTGFANFDFYHTCEVNFLKNYSIYATAGTNLSITEKKACSLGIDLTLGGKINF